MPTNGFAAKIDLSLLERISDAEFLQALEWEKAAPKVLVQSAKDGDIATFLKRFEKTLPQVDHSQNGSSTKPGGFAFESILTLVGETDDKQVSQFVSTLSKSAIVPVESRHKQNGLRKSRPDVTDEKNRLLSQLEYLAKNAASHPALLAIFYELILHSREKFASQERFHLWRFALTVAVRFYREKLPLSKFADREDVQLLIEGELAWKTGVLFGGLKGTKNLLHSGRKYLRSTIEARTDTDGTPHADLVPNLANWLACFVRADVWADEFDELVWDEDSEDRFQSTVRRIAALCDRNGDLALGTNRPLWSSTMLQTGISQAGWRAKSKPAQLLQEIVLQRISGQSTKSNGKPFKWNEEKSPMFQSDWAAFAGLRSDWSRRADAIFVTHNETFPQIALMADGVPIFSGDWHLQLDVDGKPISLADDWDCTCWFTDKDADFIELHQEVEDVTIDRQIFLSRTNRFAVFADCISGPETSVIDYTSALPVTQNVTFKKEKTTRECSLKTKELKVRCFPLLLPQDRIENAGGDYRPHDTGLRLEYKTQGGVFAPQIFDWSPRRKRGRAEWRQLTVTEDGKVMKKRVAGGYRMRLGNHHLLLYRSLEEPGTGRSVLGHHTRHETVYGIFGSKGEVDPLLLVE